MEVLTLTAMGEEGLEQQELEGAKRNDHACV